MEVSKHFCGLFAEGSVFNDFSVLLHVVCLPHVRPL